MDLLLTAIGLALIILGIILVMVSLASARARVRGGGLILIGPFPIVFGDRSMALVLLVVGVFLVFIILFLGVILGLGGA